jgi:hypothetical protein
LGRWPTAALEGCAERMENEVRPVGRTCRKGGSIGVRFHVGFGPIRFWEDFKIILGFSYGLKINQD